ncbi:MAG: ABC transporter ATP-binding protein [Actinobacteria bacterium]|nr:ABC transporter ATP-binding protein [Actinomycetota bacterium]
MRSVKKKYGKIDALRGVDLEIAPGSIVALLGPNGAGKTTLSNVICGLLRPDEGDVLLDGASVVRHPGQVRRHIGYAPQELAVYPTRTVLQHLDHFGRLTGLRGGRLRAEIDAVVVALRLDGLIDRKVSQLSGGEKRRAHAAVAFIGRPRVLILDEPTAGADVQTRRAILDAVVAAAQAGVAVCYCTHYLPEVEQLGAEVAVITHGSIVYRGPLAKLGDEDHPTVVVQFSGEPPQLPASKVHIDPSPPGELRFRTAEPVGVIQLLFERLSGSTTTHLVSLEVKRSTLEDRFMALVGDGEEPGEVVLDGTTAMREA